MIKTLSQARILTANKGSLSNLQKHPVISGVWQITFGQPKSACQNIDGQRPETPRNVHVDHHVEALGHALSTKTWHETVSVGNPKPAPERQSFAWNLQNPLFGPNNYCGHAFWLFLALNPSRIFLTLCAIFTGGPYPVSGQKHRKNHGQRLKSWRGQEFKIIHSWPLWDEVVPIKACEHAGPASPAFGRCPKSAVWKVEVPGATPQGAKHGFQDDRMLIKSLRICPGTKGLRYRGSRGKT